MAQLQDIRRRITSINKTQQVTRAMKLIATVKLQKARETLFRSKPYANKIREMITSVLQAKSLPEHPFTQKNSNSDLHLLVISGDRGLCGNFNSNLLHDVKAVNAMFESRVTITVVGKKGYDLLSKCGYKVDEALTGTDKQPSEEIAGYLSQKFSKMFVESNTGSVAVTYNEFRVSGYHKTVTEWLLPIDVGFITEEFQTIQSNENISKRLFLRDQIEKLSEDVKPKYIFYPDPETLLELLMPRYLLTQIQRMVLESRASEFSARMNAMEKASHNTEKMLESLTLDYNRSRQAAITNELIEIMSGAKALMD